MDIRNELIQIFNDTMAWTKSDPKLKEAVKHSISGTVLFMPDDTPALPDEFTAFDTNIHVSDGKTFETALHLRKVYPEARIAVHNFASATNPGGGVTKGSRAQEECLCRCSTLYPVLQTQFSGFYQFHRNRHDVRYTDACIWSPDILIIKNDDDFPERLPEQEWCTVDVLTCAAPNLRPMPNNVMNPGKDKPIRLSDAELLALHKSRARHMLAIAAANGDEVLVLGAFGCGAFQNNPGIVARAYLEILPEFQGRFRHVEFAVFCTRRERDNFNTFQRILGR